MYLNLTPRVLRNYERESGKSFFDLLTPSVYNLYTLISLGSNLSSEEVELYIDNALENKDLGDLYKSFYLQLEEMGYIGSTNSKSEDESTNSEDVSNRFKSWTKIWENGFADAYALGVNANDYWELSPKEILAIFDKKVELRQSDMDTELANSWYMAQLTAVGVNDPKKFPKKPHSVKNVESKEEVDDLELALQFANKWGLIDDSI